MHGNGCEENRRRPFSLLTIPPPGYHLRPRRTSRNSVLICFNLVSRFPVAFWRGNLLLLSYGTRPLPRVLKRSSLHIQNLFTFSSTDLPVFALLLFIRIYRLLSSLREVFVCRRCSFQISAYIPATSMWHARISFSSRY